MRRQKTFWDYVLLLISQNQKPPYGHLNEIDIMTIRTNNTCVQDSRIEWKLLKPRHSRALSNCLVSINIFPISNGVQIHTNNPKSIFVLSEF